MQDKKGGTCMICKNCGTDVADELTFCTTCGEELQHEEEKKRFFANKKDDKLSSFDSCSIF